MVCCCHSAILSSCSGRRGTHPALPLLRPSQSLGTACSESEAVGKTSLAVVWVVRGSPPQMLPAWRRRRPVVRLAWRLCSCMLTVTQLRDLTLSCTMRNLALHGDLLESAASGTAACAQTTASPAPAIVCQISHNKAMQAIQALSGRDAADTIRNRWWQNVHDLQAAQWVHAHADAELACAWAHALARNLVCSVFSIVLLRVRQPE